MDNAPSFTPSILSSQAANVDVLSWDTVVDSWEKKKYLDTVQATLKYINPAVFKKYGNKERTVFRIPHGSVIVNIEITDEKINVSAPFLKLPQSQKVPLLRQVAQINFSPLTLAQIYLKDDELMFYGECDLDLCEPYKLYAMLREICINADNYDDKFIEDFGAERIHEPEVMKYSDKQLDKVWEDTLHIIQETREYVQYFEDKRWHGLAWDTLNNSMKRLDYCVAPQGNIRNEMERVIGFMQAKGDTMVHIDEAKKMFDKIEHSGKEKFIQDIYKVDVFVPYKCIGLLQDFKNHLQPSYERALKERSEGKHMMLTMTCLYAFYNLFYSYNVIDDTTDFITRSLKKASGTPWKKASGVLATCLFDIMNGRHTPRVGGSFLSSIFKK